MVIRRGDIFYADLRPVIGSEPVSYTHLADVEDIYMIRARLEGLCARLAAERVSTCLLYTSRCV